MDSSIYFCDMNAAVICYSYTHNNLILAGEIQARTAGTLFNIEEKTPRTRWTIFLDLFLNRTPRIKEYLFIPDRFDHYILISPIWGGRIATPLKAFLKKEGSHLKSYSFISICGGNNPGGNISRELEKLIGIKPLAVSELALVSLPGVDAKNVMAFQFQREHLRYFEQQLADHIDAIAAPVQAQ